MVVFVFVGGFHHRSEECFMFVSLHIEFCLFVCGHDYFDSTSCVVSVYTGVCGCLSFGCAVGGGSCSCFWCVRGGGCCCFCRKIVDVPDCRLQQVIVFHLENMPDPLVSSCADPHH